MKYICGAYTSAPSLNNASIRSEAEFYSNINLIKQIKGLEIPFWGENCHPFGNSFLNSYLKKDWKNSLTCIPSMVTANQLDDKIGLASTDEGSRLIALQIHKKAYESFLEFNNHFGINIFENIHLSSAPCHQQQNSSVSSFTKSLEEIIKWNWDSSKIFIEHCDKYNLEGRFEKGYLSLEEEILAIKNVASNNIGFVVNTGRSSIEGKKIETVNEHIELICNHNIPVGIIFSGTSNVDNSPLKWKDLHVPFGCFNTSKFPYKNSILSKSNVKKIFNNLEHFLNQINFFGFKLMPLDPKNASIKKRIGINEDAIKVLNSFLNK